MLVILNEEQVFSARQVCQGCLLADQQGLPRWQPGRLQCGNAVSPVDSHQPILYECQMGFKLTNIET
jgi:hypothetical protein